MAKYGVISIGGGFEATAIITVARSEYRRPGVIDEGSLSDHGISYWATCDGFLFRDQEVAVDGVILPPPTLWN